jgi:hypothetical protein
MKSKLKLVIVTILVLIGALSFGQVATAHDNHDGHHDHDNDDSCRRVCSTWENKCKEWSEPKCEEWSEPKCERRGRDGECRKWEDKECKRWGERECRESERECKEWKEECDSHLTPTPTTDPCANDQCVTPTPTEESTTTTATIPPAGHGDGLSDGRSDGRSDGSCSKPPCSGSGQVLGASTGPTQAVLGLSTTSGEGNLALQLIQLFGALTSGVAGFTLFKRSN